MSTDSRDPAYYPDLLRMLNKKKCLNYKAVSVGEGGNAGRRSGGYFAVSYMSRLSAAECDSVFWKVRKLSVSAEEAGRESCSYTTYCACERRLSSFPCEGEGKNTSARWRRREVVFYSERAHR